MTERYARLSAAAMKSITNALDQRRNRGLHQHPERHQTPKEAIRDQQPQNQQSHRFQWLS
jgi:hypothetical protein